MSRSSPKPPAPAARVTPLDKLTDMQRTLVVHYVEHAGTKLDAINAAGYQEQAGYAAFRSERVKDAIGWLVRERISMSTPRALQSIIDLAEGSKSHKVRLEAAKDLLDRAGFGADASGGASLQATQVNISIDLGE